MRTSRAAECIVVLLCAFAANSNAAEGKESNVEPIYKKRPGGREVFDRVVPGITVGTDAAPPLEIAPGVYQSDGMSNSWLLTTDTGRIVINAGMAYEAPLLRRKYDAVDDSPIRYIIFTQAHVDHVGGVGWFTEDHPEIIAHEGNLVHQARDRMMREYKRQHSAFAFTDVHDRMDTQASDAIPEHILRAQPNPTITFEDTYSFSLGKLNLELMWIPGGETDESIIVWLPQEQTAIVGNLFGALFGHIPNLVTLRGDKYREASTFLTAIERVRALKPEVLAVGHHEPLVGKENIERELSRLHGAVSYLHDETIRYMNQGKDVYTAMAEIQLPSELEVGQGYGKVAWNVRAIWESYVGWFHHLSTTELYAPPPSSVYPDLVELAGPTRVVERARARLEAGDPVEAIHLAEAVLALESDNEGALTVYLDSHVRLEAVSENFWEMSWLRDQIRKTREKLAQTR